MVTVYPHTTYRPVSGAANDPGIIPVGCILHVAVSEARSLYDYFNGPSGGIESHLYLRRDGTGEQYRDLDREADANLQANSWIGSDGRRYGFHSIETQGMEHGKWTGAQIDAIQRFLVWDSGRYGWPLRVVSDNNWRSGGVGYHVMLGAPGPWTPVAKTCPGPDRVRQFNNVIVPWLQSGAQEDDDMTPEQERKLNGIYEVLANGNAAQLTNPRTGDDVSVRYGVQEAWQTAEQLYQVLCNSNTAEMRRPGGGTASVRYGVQQSWAGIEAVKAMVAELAAGPSADPEEFLARVEQRVEAAAAAGVDAEIPAVVSAVLEALGDRAGLSQDDVVAALKQAMREGTDTDA